MRRRPITLAEVMERVYEARGGLLADHAAMLAFPDRAARPDAEDVSPADLPPAHVRTPRRRGNGNRG